MNKQQNIDERLAAEAKFQNQRVLAARNDSQTEPRDKFYYLAQPAKDHYRTNIFMDVAHKNVLVAGCSEGGVTPLARHGANVLGVDISDVAIQYLNNSISREGLANVASARVMNAENLEVPPQSLDLICCSGVLHHLDVDKAAKSWSQALKPSGRVCMIEPMAWNPAVALYRIATPSMRTKDEHPLTPSDIRLLKNYFSTVKMHGYVLTSVLSVIFAYLPNLFNLKEHLFTRLSKIDHALLQFFPFLNYFCWTVVIELYDPISPPPNAAQK